MKESRFTYHTEDDDPGEGGVHSVASTDRKTGRPTIASNGVPGPEEPQLDINELVRTIGMRYTHLFALPTEVEPEIGAVTPIVGSVTLTNSGAALILKGHAKAILRLDCGRCLSPTDVEVEADLEESFDLIAHNSAFRQQDEVQAVDENTEAAVVENNIFKLSELLRQSLLLAAPLQIECPPDCPGRARLHEIGVTLAGDPEPPKNNALSILGELWTKREGEE